MQIKGWPIISQGLRLRLPSPSDLNRQLVALAERFVLLVRSRVGRGVDLIHLKGSRLQGGRRRRWCRSRCWSRAVTAGGAAAGAGARAGAANTGGTSGAPGPASLTGAALRFCILDDRSLRTAAISSGLALLRSGSVAEGTLDGAAGSAVGPGELSVVVDPGVPGRGATAASASAAKGGAAVASAAGCGAPVLAGNGTGKAAPAASKVAALGRGFEGGPASGVGVTSGSRGKNIVLEVGANNGCWSAAALSAAGGAAFAFFSTGGSQAAAFPVGTGNHNRTRSQLLQVSVSPSRKNLRQAKQTPVRPKLVAGFTPVSPAAAATGASAGAAVVLVTAAGAGGSGPVSQGVAATGALKGAVSVLLAGAALGSGPG